MSQPDDLSPEEERVRRLLADARHTEPLPDDVASRLDAVLADLRHEDPAVPAPIPATRRPSDLAAARRRRNVRSWLVAAAAVVVVGVGFNQLDLSGGSSDSDTSGAGSSADRAESGDAPGDAAGDAAGPNHLSAKPSETAPQAAESPELDAGVGRPVRLDATRFTAQVSRIQRDSARNLSSYGLGETAAGAAEDEARRATCPDGGWGRGRAVLVRYDGDPGVLVFRQVRGDTQVVDLFLCGADHPERSVTLTAP